MDMLRGGWGPGMMGNGLVIASGPDVTAPTAITFTPADNATFVSLTANLVVLLSEDVVLGTGNITLKRTSDNVTIEAWDVVTEAGTGAGQVSVEFGTDLTMRLTTSLAGGVEYYVIWDANVVKDLSNNPVAANASTTLWSFTTAGSAYDAATEAIAAAFTTPPTTARKGLIDAAVVSLKSAGVWDKLDALYCFAAADSQAAKINWKAPGTYNCTEVNAPSFVTDQGFQGASTKYLDSAFNPTTAPTPHLTQNNAMVFGWSLTDTNTTNTGFIGHATSTSIQACPRAATNLGVYQINSAGSSVIAVTDGLGLWAASREAATTIKAYKNGSLVDTKTVTSAAPVNESINFLRRTTGYWTGTMAVGGFGSQLSAAENTALYNALNTYLVGVGAVSSYQAETNAIAAAFTTPPTTARKNLIDAAVVALKSAGVWAKLDALYAFAAADSQAAKINWVNPGTYNATEVNAPAFAADLGFTGASTKYLDSGFNPTTAPTPKFVQDSATAFGWAVTNVAVIGGLVGNVTGTSLIIEPRYTGDVYYIRLNNTGTNITAASTDSTGLWVATRSSSVLTTVYKNGASINTSAGVSVAPQNVNITFMRAQNTDYWTGQCAAGGIGQSLNSTEQTALYNALRTYLTGVGVP